MKYTNVISGKFVDRPNRFTAHVEIDGVTETVHVKNTGRLSSLLIPGNTVSLEKSANPNRKTKYDLIAVEDPKLGWVNVDSQVPNKVVLEWLKTKDYDFIKPEYVYGDSRIDFYMEKVHEVSHGGQGLYAGDRWYRIFPGCTHRQGSQAFAGADEGGLRGI